MRVNVLSAFEGEVAAYVPWSHPSSIHETHLYLATLIIYSPFFPALRLSSPEAAASGTSQSGKTFLLDFLGGQIHGIGQSGFLTPVVSMKDQAIQHPGNECITSPNRAATCRFVLAYRIWTSVSTCKCDKQREQEKEKGTDASVSHEAAGKKGASYHSICSQSLAGSMSPTSRVLAQQGARGIRRALTRPQRWRRQRDSQGDGRIAHQEAQACWRRAPPTCSIEGWLCVCSVRQARVPICPTALTHTLVEGASPLRHASESWYPRL